MSSKGVSYASTETEGWCHVLPALVLVQKWGVDHPKVPQVDADTYSV